MAGYSYLNNFQSLMGIANLLNGEQFSTFLQDVVYPYRTGTPRNTDGFEQLPLKPSFKMTYAALQQENNISVMANHVALDAHAKPDPTKGVNALEGTIPHVATNITLGQEDYLKIAEALFEAEMVGGNLITSAQDMLAKRFDEKFQKHDDRSSYMRDYVVFHGKYDITEANNAGGFNQISFDFRVPEKNTKKLSNQQRWWTDVEFKTEGTSCDPVADIENVILDMMSTGIAKSNIEIEIGFMTLHHLARHSKVRAAIALNQNQMLAGNTIEERAKTTFGMNDDQLVAGLESLLGVTFKPRTFITSLWDYNKTLNKMEQKPMTGFVEGRLVFRVKGNIGEIHSSAPLRVGGEQGSDGMYGMYDRGRILMTYTCNLREKIQIWDTEETSLYVLTAGKNMRYLDVMDHK